MTTNIDPKTQGAWLIHHASKLQTVVNASAFENINIAGKAGMLLSALSTSKQLVLDHNKVNILAQEANINTLEKNALLDILKKNELINIGDNGIEILGLTTAATLEHTSKIFEKQNPKNIEIASIVLSEMISDAPYEKNEILSKISDTYQIKISNLKSFETNIEEMGLVDIEKIDNTKTLYFNGHLFKRGETQKIQKVLSTLIEEENTKLLEFNDLLTKKTCISTTEAEKILGKTLFSKLSSIGMYDINIVSNEQGEVGFLTKPSSFSKYSSSDVDDAFDLAKAFVSSLTYGMTKSSSSRGQITMIERLLNALIRGEEIGPVDAIGQDYRILELKHVVEIKQGSKTNFNGNLRTGWMMKLLKIDVCILALQAIKQGDISEQSLEFLPGAAVSKYRGPEINRTIVRKKLNERTPKDTNDMIMALRTGKII
jgi:hypothetical protein